MTALGWMTLSGLLAGLSNLCLRRHLDLKGSSQSFITTYLLLTTLVTIWLYPMQSGSYKVDALTVGVGILCGFALAGMKWMISRALQKGPSGLTFATINSISIAPSIIFVLLFNQYIDVSFNIWNVLGSILVVGGLFWATKRESTPSKREWLIFSFSGCLFYLAYLVLTQLYPSLINQLNHGEPNDWFLPISFGVATLIHFFGYQERNFQRRLTWGTVGGILNGLCAALFMHSIQMAEANENAIIIPLFTVSLITACNCWGQWLYHESVDWIANGICMLGICISTL